MRPFLMSLALALGLCVYAGAAPPDKKAPTATILVLTDERPLLIAVDMLIDGQSVQAAFEKAQTAFLGKLFVWLDRNKDGNLDTVEAGRLPMSLVSIPGLRPAELEAVNIAYNFDAIDADGNGKVSKVELSDFLTEFGMNPLSVTVERPEQPIPAQLQSQFFKHFDTDGDGKLSAKELESAYKLLGKHDSDEDERLDIFEVIGPRPNIQGLEQVRAMQRPRNQEASPDRVMFLDSDRLPGSVGRMIFQHYAAQGGKNDVVRLTAKQLGLDAATFKQLDSNKDQLLDAEELDRVSEVLKADALTVRLGKRDARAAVLEGPQKSPIRLQDPGQFRISGSAWVEGRALPGAMDEGLLGNLARGYKLNFEAADRNSDDKIDAAERRNSRLFSTIGDAVDRDGNGTIEKQEMTDWVEQVVQPLAHVLMSRASITISSPGNGVWDLLDTNRDGFLSERELRRAPSFLKDLDRNGDGHLQEEEVPTAYQVTVARGEASLTSRGQFVRLELAADGRLTYPTRQDLGGPTWFRKMDRNGDGDVSQKEFLGSPQQFRKLDADSDGLISLEEAEASSK